MIPKFRYDFDDQCIAMTMRVKMIRRVQKSFTYKTANDDDDYVWNKNKNAALRQQVFLMAKLKYEKEVRKISWRRNIGNFVFPMSFGLTTYGYSSIWFSTNSLINLTRSD